MKKELQDPIYLEISFDDVEDIQSNLEKILKSSDFLQVIKTEVLPRVVDAIEQNKKELTLFRMVYYGLDLVVEKKHYKSLLSKILAVYEQEEDYLKCVELKKLIDIL